MPNTFSFFLLFFFFFGKEIGLRTNYLKRWSILIKFNRGQMKSRKQKKWMQKRLVKANQTTFRKAQSVIYKYFMHAGCFDTDILHPLVLM